MELPALLPSDLLSYRNAADDYDLLISLRSHLKDLIPFVTAACDDETWAEAHPLFMSKAIEVLTRRFFRQKLFPKEARPIISSLRTHWKLLQTVIPNDLTIIFDDRSYSVNSLLFVADSSFFRYLVISECVDKNKKTLIFHNPSFDRDFFEQYLAYCQTGDLPYLWHKPEAELIKFIKMAVDCSCLPLETLAAETYGRYLSTDNVLEMATYAFSHEWKQLFSVCQQVANQTPSGIHFLVHPPGFSVQLTQFDEETLKKFEIIQSEVTHLSCRGELAVHPLLSTVVKGCRFLYSLDVAEATTEEEIFKAVDRRLEFLNLTLSEWITGPLLEQLATLCPHLTRLILAKNTYLSYLEWGSLHKWKELSALDLTGCYQINENDLKIILKGSPYLQELSLAECMRLPDDSFYEIGKSLPGLQILNLSKTMISDRALVDIAFRCHHIRRLILRKCPYLSEKGLLESAKYLSRLRELDITGCSISNEVKAQLSRLHPFLQISS